MSPIEEMDFLLERINVLYNRNGKPKRILMGLEKLLLVKWYQFRKMNEAIKELDKLGISFNEVRTLFKEEPLPRLKRLLGILENAQKEETRSTNSTRDAISSRLAERHVGASSPLRPLRTDELCHYISKGR
jgi:hypothetical protein